MMPESLPSYSGFASGAAGQAYNQAAFRHFLAIERKRAERSGRPLLLVLVALRGNHADNRIAGATASAIFRGLGDTIREVDFVGWFREGTVAGAVLTQGGTAAEPTRAMVAERITGVLQKHVPASLGSAIRVRVMRFEPRIVADSPTQTALASGH